MAGKNGVYDLWYDGIVVSDNSREKRTTLAQFADKIVSELILYTAGQETLFRKWTLAKFAERPRETHGDNPQGKQLTSSDYTPARVADSGGELSKDFPGGS